MILLTTSALGDECDDLASRVAEKEHLLAKPKNQTGLIVLNHPTIPELSIGCPIAPGKRADLFGGWDAAHPPAEFFSDMGRIGQAVIGIDAEVIRSGMKQCFAKALRSKTEIADIEFHGMSLECQAFTRDGGGTVVTLYRSSK
jgi:hypothetical protein